MPCLYGGVAIVAVTIITIGENQHTNSSRNVGVNFDEILPAFLSVLRGKNRLTVFSPSRLPPYRL